MSGYGNFAAFYDALTRNVEYEKRAEHYLQLMERFGCTPSLLLDLACGTGSMSLCFARRGLEVIGVDGSVEMLSVARQKAAAENRDILFLHQQMERLDLYGTVQAAVCALDSINHVTTPTRVRRVFQRVSLFLEPGGIFAFDANTLWKHSQVLANHTFVYEEDEVYCVWQNEWIPGENLTQIHLDFFQKEDGAYWRTEEDFCERAYAPAELQLWLKNAGLEPLGCFGEFSMDPPEPQAERTIFLARKV